MSARDLIGLFSWLRVKRTEMIGKDSNIVSVFSQTPPRDPQDDAQLPDVNDETEPAEWGEHYGFATRPPADCEHFAIRAGASIVSIASRMLSALAKAGKLSEGDVAIYSIGGNVIRLNANGSISCLVPTSDGKQMVIRLDPKGKGSLKWMNSAGMCIEASEENGIALNAGDKDITLAGKNIQINGMALNNNCPVFKSTITATTPFTGGPLMKPNPGLMV
jgi:phage gp45-like